MPTWQYNIFTHVITENRAKLISIVSNGEIADCRVALKTLMFYKYNQLSYSQVYRW